MLNPWRTASMLLTAATGSYLPLPRASVLEITAQTGGGGLLSEGVSGLENGVTKSLHVRYQWMWGERGAVRRKEGGSE